MAAENSNNSALSMAQASNPVKIETISIPGFGSGGVTSDSFDPLKYRVKYLKVDVDDLEGITMLELLETKGLKGEQIVILNKTGWTFMDKYMMLVTYLERTPITPL
jgi:hypothetical protein